MLEVSTDDRDLLQDVPLHARHGVQQEDGENAGYDAESAGEGATSCVLALSSDTRELPVRGAGVE